MEQPQGKKPVAPYLVIGISSIAYNVGSRADISRNLDNIEMCIESQRIFGTASRKTKLDTF